MATWSRQYVVLKPFLKGRSCIDIFLKAAALLDVMINDHPCIDGKKRTGISASALFLRANGWSLKAGNEELLEFTLQVAISHPDLSILAEWFGHHGKYTSVK